MLSRKMNLTALLFGAGMLYSAPAAQAQFDVMLRRIPNGANAIMLLDADGIHNSPLAVSENWKQAHQHAYNTKPIILPPDAKSVVLAAQLDTATLEHDWQAGVIRLKSPASMPVLAKAEGGHTDQLGGVDVVWSPFDVYFIDFKPKLLGMLSPASRQDAVHWVKQKGQWKCGNLSGYLMNAANAIGGADTHIVLAVDLEDAVDPTRIEHRLGETNTLQGTKVDLARFAKVIASMRGVTLGIRIDGEIQGRMTMDFKEDVSMLQDYAKPLLLEMLDDHGLSLKGMDSWKASVSGKKIAFSGDMSKGELSLVFSLLEMPVPAHGTEAPAAADAKAGDSAPASPELAMPEASQQYFKSMDAMLQNVADHSRSATWIRKTSERISRLPVLNVDPDLLDYSGQIADLLSQAANVQSGHRLAANARMAAVRPGTGYYYGGRGYRVGYHGGGYYGYGYHSDNYGKRRQIRAQERAAGIDTTNDIFRQVQDLTSQAKDQMTQRYHIAF